MTVINPVPFKPNHMRAILEIERLSFPEPWSLRDFARYMVSRKILVYVAELRDRHPVGFAMIRLGDEDAELLNFAVHPEWRRNRVGKQLLGRLIVRTNMQHKRRWLSLTVREGNLGAQQFFAWAGFKAIDVLRGHYEQPVEDAYVMQLDAAAAVELAKKQLAATRAS